VVTVIVMHKVQIFYFLPQSPFLCFMHRRSDDSYFLCRNKWLVFITEKRCVYCAVRTGYLHIIQVRSQCAFGKSCDRPTRPLFTVVFLRHRASNETVPKVHFALRASHSALSKTDFKFFVKPQPFQSNQNFVIMLPSKHKIQSKFSSPFFCCTLPTVNYPPSYFLHFPVFFISNSLSLPEGQAGTACEPSEQLTFLTPSFIIISAVLLTSRCTSHIFLPPPPSLSLSVFKGLTRH